MFVVGGEIREADGLLGMIWDAREEVYILKIKWIDQLKDRGQKCFKMELGLLRRRNIRVTVNVLINEEDSKSDYNGGENDGYGGDTDKDDGGKKRKRCRSVNHGSCLVGEMDLLG